eukprot:contig_17496_g4283
MGGSSLGGPRPSAATSSVEAARAVYRRGLANAPQHAPLYRTAGEIEAVAGNAKAARALFREGLRRDPGHAPLYHALAKLEARYGNVGALAALA